MNHTSEVKNNPLEQAKMTRAYLWIQQQSQPYINAIIAYKKARVIQYIQNIETGVLTELEDTNSLIHEHEWRKKIEELPITAMEKLKNGDFD